MFSVFGLIPSLITSVTSANLFGATVDKAAANKAKIHDITKIYFHLFKRTY